MIILRLIPPPPPPPPPPPHPPPPPERKTWGAHPPPPPPPPLKKVSSHWFPHTWFTCRISSSGTNITSKDSLTYVEESFEESSESLDSELVSSSHELIGRFLIFYSISGTKVPACLRENSGIPDWLSCFLKLNLIMLCFIYNTLNLYCYWNFNSLVFHVLLNYDAMCANV